MTIIDYSTVGRSELLSLLAERDAEAERAATFILKLAKENEDLTAKVETCRTSHTGIYLPGWWCTRIKHGVPCDTFMGESKEPYTVCRICGESKMPSTPAPKVRV